MKNVSFKDITIFLLVLLYTYTATSKIIENDNFIAQMALSPAPFMKSAAPFLGWAIPMIEAIIIIFLLINRLRFWGLWGSLLLLTGFEIYIAAMLSSGKHLPCACGGIIAKMSWLQHIFFNAFFITLNLITIIRYKYPDETSSGADLKNILRA